MGSKNTPFGPPFLLRPDQYALGLDPVRQMLNSDLPLQGKFTSPNWTPGTPWAPSVASFDQPSTAELSEADVGGLCTYAQSVDTNLLLPAPAGGAPAAKEDEPFWDFSMSGPSRSTEDGGISETQQRGVREYLKSGYTRTNPDGTYEVDNDFGGKWSDDITIGEAKVEHEFFDVAVAEGTFGEDSGIGSGSARVLSADSSVSAGFELTTTSLKSSAEIQASGSVAEIEVESEELGPLKVKANAALLSAEAKAKAEITVTPEEATVQGKLGAEVNLVEVGAEGEIVITPRRAVNIGVKVWNRAFDDNVEELGENWDIGFVIGAGAGAQIGAQLGAEGELSYKDGRAVAEAGIKAGLGVGADLKVHGGFVGADKVWAAATDLWDSMEVADPTPFLP